MPVQLVRQPDAESLARHAARDLVMSIQDAREARGVAHVCLAGGSTPLRCYELLDGQLDDWSAVHLWYGDERCVPFDDPESNHGQVKERLRARGAVWHPMPATLGPGRGRDRVQPRARRHGPGHHPSRHGPRRPHRLALSQPPAARRPRRRGRDHRLAQAAAAAHHADAAQAQRVAPDRPDGHRRGQVGGLGARHGRARPHLPASLLDRTKLLVMADNAALPA